MPRPRDLERHDSRASLRREAALWQGSPGSRLIDAQESGCRSSVVEHSLGKGEVVSSILTGSTSNRLSAEQISLESPASPARETRMQIFALELSEAAGGFPHGCEPRHFRDSTVLGYIPASGRR